jgi:hypothetical protein
MDLSTTGMALFLYTLRSIPVPVRCLAKPALDIPVPTEGPQITETPPKKQLGSCEALWTDQLRAIDIDHNH